MLRILPVLLSLEAPFSAALVCVTCHTPFTFHLKDKSKTIKTVMMNRLHTGISTMKSSILLDPSNNFDSSKALPDCLTGKPLETKCSKGDLCGYAEFKDKYFARHCVKMSKTLYNNATTNRCYIHGTVQQKTTFLYCDKDKCNEKHIKGIDREECTIHFWNGPHAAKKGGSKGANGETSTNKANDKPCIARGQVVLQTIVMIALTAVVAFTT